MKCVINKMKDVRVLLSEKGFLKRGYSKHLFHRKQCQAINLFVLSLAPESIV